jgi:hypothetical protein
MEVLIPGSRVSLTLSVFEMTKLLFCYTRQALSPIHKFEDFSPAFFFTVSAIDIKMEENQL